MCEGLPIQINIKNKEPRRLPRTPVILTCNEVPWKNFGNEASPIMNRMFAWRNLYPSKVLQHIDGKDADPRFFAEMFSFIHEKIASRPEWCPVEDIMQKTNYYELYVDMIADHLKQLIREEALTLTDVINRTVMKRAERPLVDFYDWEAEHTDDRLNCQAVLAMDEDSSEQYQFEVIAHWLKILKDPNSMDYYWNFDDFRRPVLISKLTDAEYDMETDIDERDYATFKRGYIIIQRLLILIKNFPNSMRNDNFDAATFHNEKYMIKTVLKAMSAIRTFIIRECAQWNITKMMNATEIEREIQQDVHGQHPPEDIAKRQKKESWRKLRRGFPRRLRMQIHLL